MVLNTIVTIVWAIVLLALTIMGCVLGLRFAAGKLDRYVRVVIAAALGPGLYMLYPLFVLAQEEGFENSRETWIGLIVAGVAAFVIGFPISYFTTRKLDRLFVPSTTIFE